jgi:ATP-dependent Clp protease ATP-binding subunit ClpC
MGSELDRLQRRAREICERNGHFYIGTEHFFLAVLEDEPYLKKLLADYGIDDARVVERINELADYGDGQPLWHGLPTSPRLTRVIALADKEVRDIGSKDVRSWHYVAAILREGKGIPARVLVEMNGRLDTLRKEVLRRGPMPVEQVGTPERSAFSSRRIESGPADSLPASSAAGAGSGAAAGSAAAGDGNGSAKNRKSVLNDYGRDLVALAMQGKLEPVIGRADEIRRCLQILTRKGKNNPVLIGEAGVGKSSVAYGLAQRIASGRVPEMLQGRALWEISMNRLVAGAAYRGEFQERMQKLMDEVTGRNDVVLFIDEIHMLVGAGGDKGALDASNILKPALARGDFPVIGATTTEEYRKSIESDPALERRFQPVLVNEPSEAECLQILEGLRPRYESHHGVKITDKALKAAVKMSTRYLPDRYLPDKAIDIIDEAASKVKINSVSMSISPECPPSFEVTSDVVAEVVSAWAQIPVTQLTEEEEQRLLNIEDHLRSRVLGQDEAIDTVAKTIRVMRMGLGNPNRPGGVFLFLGSSGVGKTELARALAEFLFGSEKDLVRVDMSEYMEKHAISRMIGSPPGYVGHEEEGQLTRAVRTRPYSVVLLDEVEKAHVDVFDLFLQVFDDGRLTDSKGRTVNFTNTIIIMTSNIGTKSDTPSNPDDPTYRESVMEALRQKFRPEFLNRIDEIVMFRPLAEKALDAIVSLQLSEFTARVRDTRGVVLAVEPDARKLILERGFSPAYGARPLKRAVQTLLINPLAEWMLRENVEAGAIVRVNAHSDKLLFARDGLDSPRGLALVEPSQDDMAFWKDDEPEEE